MADEILKRDENNEPVIGLVTDDASEEIRMGRIDDSTKGLKVMLVGGAGSGTVTSISQGTGILLSTNPIVATGSVSLATALQPMATLTGNSLKFLRVNVGETAVEYASVGTGTVTNVSSADANATVANQTTTPVITIVSAPKLQNARTIGGVSFDGTGNITVASATGGFTVSGGDLAIGANNITISGSIGVTGTRVTKLWATDIESTNIPTVGGTAILTSLTAPQFTTIELGHATDTTLSRVSAGVVAIEGNNIITTATVPVKATGAELDTGTDDAKFATAKALKDSHNVPSVAPSTSGNVMTSNGTDWVSSAPVSSSSVIFIGAGQFEAGANCTHSSGNMRPILTYADGVDGHAFCSFMIPTGFTSISSVVARFRNGGSTGVDVLFHNQFSVNRVGSNDVTDTNGTYTTYTTGASAGAFQATLPTDEYNGLTSPLATGDIIGIDMGRYASDARDTLGATLEFEGLIVTLA